jgi:hypothetical protein
MDKQSILVDHERMILHASTIGFYYNYGKRQQVCNHKSCGWKSPESRQCRYISNDGWYKQYYGQQIKDHKKKGCKEDWCIKDNGPRPASWPEPIPNPCKRTYFRAYTEKELADPKTKVELVAIILSVAEQDRAPRNNIICVYDLMNDRWANDTWWKLTPKGDLSPWQDWGLDYAPKTIYGIEEVILKAKERV